MPQSLFPPLRPYHPTTFLERGVALPFTTPRLAGTRARPTETQGLELVILNPAGGRGVYILPCAALASFCTPTLHDQVFNLKIAPLGYVTPAMIRTIAAQVAEEGFAGEEASRAATRTLRADRSLRSVTNYQLLAALTQQVADRCGPASPAHPGAPLDQETRARSVVETISARLGQPTLWTFTALEDIGLIFSGIGDASSGIRNRVPQLIALLRQTRAEIAKWGLNQRDEKLTACAALVGSAADVTLSLTDTVVAEVRALTNDMVGLLRRWADDKDLIVRLAGRPEWLLDGWEQICLLWGDAIGDSDRRAALAEITALLPILPQEATTWAGSPPLGPDLLYPRRMVGFNEDWRTGEVVYDMIARNENLRAKAC